MWDGLVLLLFLCLLMGSASFLAGILPLSISLSPRQLRLITTLGTGVLVGTSLIVIIPEGVETLYAAAGEGHGHAERGLMTRMSRDVASSSLTPLELPSIWEHDRLRRDMARDAGAGIADGHDVGFRTGPDDEHSSIGNVATQNPPSSDPGHQEGVPLGEQGDMDQDPTQHFDEGSHATREPHAWVGVSLILGFILMYLIDNVPRHLSRPSQPQRFQVSLHQFNINRTDTDMTTGTPTQDTFPAAVHSDSSPSSRPSSTTVGLVIHAAADGIALGASSTNSTSSSRNLSFIIFLALMVHKAPAAFGLTSVLLKQGISKRQARTHLIIFSLAAPVGALATWTMANMLGYSGSEGASTEFATGVLLLFSGGTFLYVAMHTMQEGSSGHSHEPRKRGAQPYQSLNGRLSSTDLDAEDADMGAYHDDSPAEGKPTLVDAVVTVAGMLLPLLTQWGHAH